MNNKWLVFGLVGLLVSLLAGGCTPALSDAEFAAGAQEACRVLGATIEGIDQLHYDTKAAAYRQAAEVLGELNLTAESAPQGYALQQNLAELATALEQFDQAIQQAVSEAGMDGVQMLMLTEDGNVFGSETGSIFDVQKLNIDNELVLGINANNAAIAEAAEALGLEACAPEQLEE